jgi:hypothetical protein
MIVERRDRGVRLAVARERQPQRLLGRRLADRAGDGDHLGARARAGGAGEIGQPREHVGDDEERRVLRHVADPRARNHRQRRAGAKRGGREIVAVEIVTLDGEERLAGRDRAAVDREAADRLAHLAHWSRRFGLHGRDHGVDRP